VVIRYLLREVQALATPGRSLVVYHHHTRRAGGHHAEIEHGANRLQGNGFTTVDALRAKPYSPRVFFLLDAPAEIRQRAEQVAARWHGLITWHPDRLTGTNPRRIKRWMANRINDWDACSPLPLKSRSATTLSTGQAHQDREKV
jgi:hypothetical protein